MKKILVRADQLQLEQIFMNLISNAKDAIVGDGTISIKTYREQIQPSATQDEASIPPGEYGVFSVTDSGFGMSLETQKKIFEPFFTTKEVGKGTGLGMSIVYGIVKQSHGYIDLKSKEGAGTTFKIYLPLVNP